MGFDARTLSSSARLAFASACAVLLAGRASGASNLLKAGSFEGAEGRSFWHSNGGEVVDAPRPGAAGGRVFRVTTTEPVWQMGRQKVEVPEGAKALRISGWARTEGVKPPPDVEWRRAQMQIGYHDAAGELIGKWNDVDLPLGDSPWAFHKGDFRVSAGARTAVVFLGNNNVSGTSIFDDVRVEALDADGRGLGDAPGEAKLVAVEEAPPEPEGPVDAASDEPVEVEVPTPPADGASSPAPGDEPEDESDDDDDEDSEPMSALLQAAIGGGAVLAMMVVFALVARGRAEAPSRE